MVEIKGVLRCQIISCAKQEFFAKSRLKAVIFGRRHMKVLRCPAAS